MSTRNCICISRNSSGLNYGFQSHHHQVGVETGLNEIALGRPRIWKEDQMKKEEEKEGEPMCSSGAY